MSMSPGTLLDGRYRLEVLLSEHGGARFWRATDTVLARSVAVHVVPSDDPRAPKVLEAARSSAAVSDPHFLRVLDCEDVDGLTWVINEWGDGVSLDVMLARGTLPAMRAAWLTREVAEAIVAAHAQGLCHGRLNPEAVLVTESGAVKLIGFVVNAAFERQGETSSSPYGEISAREADVVDLAGILYAALTGKWPGVAPSALPPAPREGNRPLRPRQVRAGVPRTLDAICDRVLHKEASQHSMPIETALEIAAALSDFVGDPASVAPVDVPSMHDEPEHAEQPDPSETAVTPALTEPVEEAQEQPADEEPVEPPAAPGPPRPTPPAARPATPAPTPAAPAAPARPAARPAAPATGDPEETMATPPPYSPSGIEYFEPEEWGPSSPPPPFEQVSARPLFADEERRVPESAPTAPAATPPAGTDDWPFHDDGPEPGADRPRRRSGLKAFLIIAVAIAVAVAMYLAFIAGKDDDEPSTPNGTPSQSASSRPSQQPSATPVVSGTPVRIVAAGDFDPEGDPPAENPGRARLAIDGDPATAWPTNTYDSAALGGLKSGVGLVVDLGAVTSISSIEVALVGETTDLEFYATEPGDLAPPAELADTRQIGRVTGAGPTAVLEAPVRTRYLVVWLTRLPAVAGGFAGKIAEITVRS